MADQWYILREDRRYGPYTADQLKQYARTGHLLPIDLVLKEGVGDAVPASSVKGLFPIPTPPALTPPNPLAFDQSDQQENRAVRRKRTAGPGRLPLILTAVGGCVLVLVILVVFVVLRGTAGTSAGRQGTGGRSFAERSVNMTGVRKAGDFKPTPAGSREDFLDAIGVLSESLARSPVRPGAISKCYFPAPGCEAERWHKVFGEPERLPDGRERIGRVENTFHRWRHRCTDGSVTLGGKIREAGGKTYYNPCKATIEMSSVWEQ